MPSRGIEARKSSSCAHLLLKAGCGLMLVLSANPAVICPAEKSTLAKQVDETIREAEETLHAIDAAVKTNQYDAAQAKLQEYKTLLDAALSKTKEYYVDHGKTPSQFKQAEIRLRKQIRRLGDVRPELPVPVRPDLDAASKSAETLRQQLFKELFSPPTKK